MGGGMRLSVRGIAAVIEHTNLSPTASPDDIVRLVEEAERVGFYGVCVNPLYVRLARDVAARRVKVVSVVAFPLGALPLDDKIAVGERAVSAGADELDVVSYIGFVKGGRRDLYRDDVEGFVSHFRREHPDVVVKVIADVPSLTADEVRIVADVVSRARPHFFKTSTGYAPRGTTPDDVRLLRSLLPGEIGIKAAGGIRSLRQVVELLDAGADRIGTSTAMRIIEEARRELEVGGCR